MTNLKKDLPQVSISGFYTFNYITRDGKHHELVSIKKENLTRIYFEDDTWVIESIENHAYTIDLNFEDGLKLIQSTINGTSSGEDVDWDNIFEDDFK